MMEEDIKHLAQKNYDVIMGIYFIASDAYMQEKIKDIKLNFGERQQLLQNLIISHKTREQEIIVDNFENGKPFIDYPQLCFMYQKEFAKQKINVVYCAGSDLLKYDLNHQFYELADLLIIFERDSQRVNDSIRKQKDVIVLEHKETQNSNSTQIRQNRIQGNKVLSQTQYESIFHKFDNQ
ncbi:hypothetical protein ABPG72_014914 [Tetrahymena utriculariae]